ncbi:MAG: alpha-L-fucosidase [Verrucomicrobiota bacterium]
MNRRHFIQTTSTLAAAMAAPIDKTLAVVPMKQAAAGTVSPSGEILRFGDGRDWFFEKRFGMFVHWGIYSIPGWHEQHQWRAHVPRAEYAKLAQQWNPVKFDPEQWLDLLQESGMQQICLTTKHLDGFCLWDTQQTKFNTMNTPYKRDIVGILAEACHKRNVPLRFYYSVIDWNHPNYPNQNRSHELAPQPGDQPDLEKYLEFLKAQVRELCTNYGEVSGFWWDINVTGHRDPAINAMIRKLQPTCVINDRGFDEGDFGTPERDFEADDSVSFNRLTEACQSVGMESWGFRKDEDYYTDRHLIRSIDRYLTRDGNYLLNIGPKPDGTIPDESAAILRRIGKWYGAVKEAFTDVKPASKLTSNRDVLLTRRGTTLYVHLHKDPQGDGVKLKPFNTAPVKATMLNTGEKVNCIVNLTPGDHVEGKPCLRVTHLPVNAFSNTVLVAKLEFDRPVEELATSTSAPEKTDDAQK